MDARGALDGEAFAAWSSGDADAPEPFFASNGPDPSVGLPPQQGTVR